MNLLKLLRNIILACSCFGVFVMALKGCQGLPDNPTEEALEAAIERIMERQLSLPDGTLEDTIDITPLSAEELPDPD